MPAGREFDTLRLSGGRRLSFARYGAPAGPAVMYCHGFPGSRLEARLTDDAARGLGLQVIAFDRPGYGSSDFQSGRRLLDWPADLAGAADALGIDRFALLGISGGAPYALAAAAVLAERCPAVAIVCGLGPVERFADSAGMNLVSRSGLLLGRHAPALVRAIYGGIIARHLRWRPQAIFALLDAKSPPADRAAIADPLLRSTILDSVRAAFEQGGRGAAHDLALYANDWGFDLTDVRQRVWLWHGRQDRTVPVAFGEAMARRLPDCTPEFPDEEAHFSLPLNRAGAVLARLRDALQAATGSTAAAAAGATGSVRPGIPISAGTS